MYCAHIIAWCLLHKPYILDGIPTLFLSILLCFCNATLSLWTDLDLPITTGPKLDYATKSSPKTADFSLFNKKYSPPKRLHCENINA